MKHMNLLVAELVWNKKVYIWSTVAVQRFFRTGKHYRGGGGHRHLSLFISNKDWLHDTELFNIFC
jgi:hypothetical protein